MTNPNLPDAGPGLSGAVRAYLIALKRRLEEVLRQKADKIEGTIYISREQPLVYIDENGEQHKMGVDLISPAVGPPWFEVTPHGARVNGMRSDGDTVNPGFVDADATGQDGGVTLRVGRSTVGDVRVILHDGDGTGGSWCRIYRDEGMDIGSPAGEQMGAGTINAEQLYVGGAPVVERGSSGSSRWVKWADGTQMAVAEVSGVVINNAAGSIFRSAPVVIDHPVPFIESWSASGEDSGSSNVWAGANDLGTGVSVVLFCHTTLADRTARATVWGRWK